MASPKWQTHDLGLETWSLKIVNSSEIMFPNFPSIRSKRNTVAPQSFSSLRLFLCNKMVKIVALASIRVLDIATCEELDRGFHGGRAGFEMPGPCVMMAIEMDSRTNASLKGFKAKPRIVLEPTLPWMGLHRSSASAVSFLLRCAKKFGYLFRRHQRHQSLFQMVGIRIS